MKYGFVYIWYDRKRKMFYIGCHWGTEDDGYICSSNRMRDAYRRRPQDFKRRILKRVDDRKLLLELEHEWLSLIKKDDLGVKYYNLRKHQWGHWTTDLEKKKSTSKKISDYHKQLVKSGNHFLQSDNHPSKKMIRDNTHPWQSEQHKERTRQLQYKRVKDGTHPWCNSDLQRRTNEKRIQQGTHNFLSENRYHIDEKRCDTWEVVFPDGQIVIIKNLKLFCKQYNLNQGAMNQVGLGKKTSHKGFRCKKLKKGDIVSKKSNKEKI